MNSGKNSPCVLGIVGAIWGVVGLSMILGRGLIAIYPYAVELREYTFAWFHWVSLALSLLFMGYAEGYKGFQLKFSPRAAARALYLLRNPTLLRVLFAPLFCMGYFHASRKRIIVSYSLTIGVVMLIILVGKMVQPWRGVVDAGVLLGLGWGLLSFWFFCLKAFFGKNFSVCPETLET
ncbi:MAG TPA: hypothetical protein VIR63_06850 [Pontiella sp.]